MMIRRERYYPVDARRHNKRAVMPVLRVFQMRLMPDARRRCHDFD